MYALATILDRRLRFGLTVGGVALCVMLALFLQSVYRGVADGSVEYVRASDADLWVLQSHSTNILRSTSLLTTRHGRTLDTIPGVANASPILFLLAGVQLPGGAATTYVTGFDPESGRGGPPTIVRGRTVTGDGEIVLDRSFAAKYRLSIGDRLPIRNDTLTVVGLSAGTNMFVIQYAFVTLRTAHDIIGFSSIVSAYQVTVAPDADAAVVATRIRERMTDVAVYDRATFLANNIREMETGLLPLLFVVALIGAVVLTAILSLILSVNVLERRHEFAVMKAIGAPDRFVAGLVVQQALALALAGIAAAVIFFFPLIAAVQALAPEISPVSSPGQIAVAAAGVVAISLASSVLPNRWLRRIYPLEVFQ
ncbi:MAG: ABC transporter permease [Gemmatimonadota bacterium]|nr:ABC transporter permease [Gemmatimonadota bacterium]MDH3366820.1 ABC transporter permease [Gemmatimonadota bacterium]MDH3478753.1 ABC transporter permease [Gemmatimonadota bacterium]MDH3570241.1 ABC transporter permease [Gemmatimonadota bacterium]MDH5548921.1 ABC transporter permease [Gemmatimonadota bacterium]